MMINIRTSSSYSSKEKAQKSCFLELNNLSNARLIKKKLLDFIETVEQYSKIKDKQNQIQYNIICEISCFVTSESGKVFFMLVVWDYIKTG